MHDDDRLLTCWKEIAAHFGRTVRTVQRWEREFQLPVHRVGGQKRSSVSAYMHELDRWFLARSSMQQTRLPESLAGKQDAARRGTDLEAIVIADDTRTIVAVSPAACRLLGHSREELIGRRIDDLSSWVKNPEVPANWEQFLAAGSVQGECELVNSSGEVVRLNCSAVANFVPGFHLSVLKPLPTAPGIED